MEQLLYIVLPAVIVLLTAYLLLDRMLKNDAARRAHELLERRVSAVLPVRLQAYERLVLFLERTVPHTLVVEAVLPGMTGSQLQAVLLDTIRREYAHNVSQQVYVSDAVWSSVVAAKESLMRLVNECAAACGADAPATVLAGRIIQVYAASANTPSEQALKMLKDEVRKNYP